MTQQAIVIYTDGGCRGNPGPGGWAYVMRFGTRYREAWGAEPHTTNNRMELSAVINALSFLKERMDRARAASAARSAAPPAWVSADIHIFTDSMYVKKGISGWITDWKKRGWKTAAKKPVMNQDLWEKLDALCTELGPHFEWVEGHAGNPDNERCDSLVGLAIKGEQP
jgi:ribonuclease HI